jgi:hypothetical protein
VPKNFNWGVLGQGFCTLLLISAELLLFCYIGATICVPISGPSFSSHVLEFSEYLFPYLINFARKCIVLVCDASNKPILYPCLLLACCRPLLQSRRRTVLAGRHIKKRPCTKRPWKIRNVFPGFHETSFR